MNCIFCKIISGEIPSKKVYEDDKMIIINDINPKASIHLLMIPKEHYADIAELNQEKASDLAECLHKLSSLQNLLGIEKGFRLVVNKGQLAGQTVFHLHIHILAGENMPAF